MISQTQTLKETKPENKTGSAENKAKNQQRKPNRRGYNRKPRTPKEETQNDNKVNQLPTKNNAPDQPPETKDSTSSDNKSSATQSYSANYAKTIATAKSTETPADNKQAIKPED